jgi:mono/diheme cytochrome c family protein
MRQLLLFMCALLFLSAASVAAAQDAAVTPRVKQIYKFDCAICHGDNGNGKTDTSASMNLVLLDWTDPKALADKKDQDLFNTIRKGTTDSKMPPEEADRVKDAEIRGLITYIRGMSKGAPASTPAPAPTPAATSPGSRGSR